MAGYGKCCCRGRYSRGGVLLKFVYTGFVATLNVMTALDLMILADRFGFSFLKKRIDNCLIFFLNKIGHIILDSTNS